ncbi:xylose isomerase-like protein [Jimgerdemannia flammicorona]|nr:xylose isomerase-like protein [Jimgerdemannia flammicorona]
MQLKVFRSLWGLEYSQEHPAANSKLSRREYYEHLFSDLRALGYDGIEASISDVWILVNGDYSAASANAEIDTVADAFLALLSKNNLQYICGVYTSWDDYIGPWQKRTVAEHTAQYKSQLAIARALKPVRINVHSGSDDFTLEEAVEFFASAQDLEKDAGVERLVSHETHRGRTLYNPWTTQILLAKFPNLHITLDISHWFVVVERLFSLEAYPDLFKVVLPRVRHVHARMGTSQHAQITFATNASATTNAATASEEEQEAQKVFEEIWRAWWESLRTLGSTFNDKMASMTPEYGPPPYQISSGDVARDGTELWAMANWQKGKLRDLFAQWVTGIGRTSGKDTLLCE